MISPQQYNGVSIQKDEYKKQILWNKFQFGIYYVAGNLVIPSYLFVSMKKYMCLVFMQETILK